METYPSSINPFKEALRKVCTVLNQHEVEYLVVGGTALAFYSVYRMSMVNNNEVAEKHDFDFWFKPSYENYYKLLNALESLQIDVSGLRSEEAVNPLKAFLRRDFEDYHLDLLPEITGLEKFHSSFFNAIVFNVDGVDINVVSKDDLIRSKEATGRPKDMLDIQMLSFGKFNF